MGLIIQLVVHFAAVLVATSLPNYPHPYSPQHYCDGWNAPPWCPTQWSLMPLRWEYFCDHWCENPPNSGRRVCCEDIPLPQCPQDTRSPGDCNIRSWNPAANCRGPVGGPSPDCPTGLLCCPDACGGPICKHPKTAGDATVSGPATMALDIFQMMQKLIKINKGESNEKVPQPPFVKPTFYNFGCAWHPCLPDHVCNKIKGECVKSFTNTSPIHGP